MIDTDEQEWATFAGGKVRHYYRDGTPILDDELMPAWMKWATLFERTNRHVGQSRTFYGEYLSTVWMGLEHGWRNGRPLIFETMLFKPLAEGEQFAEEVLQLRYASEEEARECHNELRLLCLVPPKWRTFVLGTLCGFDEWRRWDDEEEDVWS